MCCETTGKGECCTPHRCCHHMAVHRHFFSKEEKIEMLERYRDELKKEIDGVEQKLQELKK